MFRGNFARDTLTDTTSVSLLGFLDICSINIHQSGHRIYFSDNIRIGGYLQNSQRTTMIAYVGVTNAISLVVKSILQVKKTYRTQMKSHEDLTPRKNKYDARKSIQQRIC